jgi:hypothetical protein
MSVLVPTNKSDLDHPASTAEISGSLEMAKLRQTKREIMRCSAFTLDGGQCPLDGTIKYIQP